MTPSSFGHSSSPVDLVPPTPHSVVVVFLLRLRPGLLLLLLPQRRKTDTRDLDDLETHTGNITLGLALATETGEEDFVVLVHEVQATVVGDCFALAPSS